MGCRGQRGNLVQGVGLLGGLWDADRAQGAGKKPNDVLIAFGAAGVRCGEQTLQTSAAPSFWSPTAQGYECCKCWLQSNPTAVPHLFFGGGGGGGDAGESVFCPTAVPQLFLPGNPSHPSPPISPPHIPEEQTLPCTSSSCCFPPGLDVE